MCLQMWDDCFYFPQNYYYLGIFWRYWNLLFCFVFFNFQYVYNETQNLLWLMICIWYVVILFYTDCNEDFLYPGMRCANTHTSESAPRQPTQPPAHRWKYKRHSSLLWILDSGLLFWIPLWLRDTFVTRTRRPGARSSGSNLPREGFHSFSHVFMDESAFRF